MNRKEVFANVAKKYLIRNDYGIQLHDIEKEVDNIMENKNKPAKIDLPNEKVRV